MLGLSHPVTNQSMLRLSFFQPVDQVPRAQGFRQVKLDEPRFGKTIALSGEIERERKGERGEEQKLALKLYLYQLLNRIGPTLVPRPGLTEMEIQKTISRGKIIGEGKG